MPHILIVDDDESVRVSLRIMLEGLGHEITEAREGFEALSLFQSRPSDLVLTDLLMPEKDGFEIIRALRKSSPGVKIIAMSGGGKIGRGPYLDMAEQLGAVHTLHKPFSKDELIMVINKALRE